VEKVDIDLYRVAAGDQCDHNRPLAHLEVGQQTAAAWMDLIVKSGSLGQNARSGGIICIKLYANLTVREIHNEERTSVPVELEFYGDSIKIRVPKYGSTLKRLRPFESDYNAGGVVSRNKLAAEAKRTFVPRPVVAGGIHIH
jgi:hypothetical protein